MFTNHKTQVSKPKKVEPTKDTSVTILTAGCTFSGKLCCRGSTRIGGRVQGEIISEGLLIIEEDASIEANISADEVIIQGTVNGKVSANIRVELTSSAIYTGDISTVALVIKEGAQFNGRSSMANEAVSVTEKGKDGRKFGTAGNKSSEELSPVVKNHDISKIKAPEVSINL